MISKTKIDDKSPFGNFLADGFSKPYRLDRDSFGEGILLYVREVIQSNLFTVETKPIEGFYVEISLRNNHCFIVLFAQSP